MATFKTTRILVLLTALSAAAWAASTGLSRDESAPAGKADDVPSLSGMGFEGSGITFGVRGAHAARTADFPRTGTHSLAFKVRFPETAAISFDVPGGLPGVARLSLFLYLPPNAPEGVATTLFLKDKDGAWFQRYARAPLRRGEWNEVSLDLGEKSTQLEARGHFAAWGREALARVREVGLVLACDRPYEDTFFLDDLVFSRGPGPAPGAPGASAVPRFTSLHAPAAVVPRLGRFEVRFQVDPSPENPFDPDELAVDAHFQKVDDTTKNYTLPAFYFQDYRRLLTAAGERLIPVGPAGFRARFTPLDEGEYRWWLSLKSPAGNAMTHPRTFTAAPAAGHGFVRVSEKDPRYFEFGDGTFFYPIGHNIRSPNDPRGLDKIYRVDLGRTPEERGEIMRLHMPDEGTFTYDKYFRKMAENGESLVETWLASWWLALEWTDQWKGFQGLGRYNLENAWRLDYLLGEAERLGLYLHLVLENHGKLCNIQSGPVAPDIEWPLNPYRSVVGPLAPPEEFFASDEARKQYQKFLRYLAGRYAWSPRIMGFELVSELDLTGGGRDGKGQPDQIFRTHGPKVMGWHREMSRFLKGNDPYGHLVTTHFSGSVEKIYGPMAREPYLDYLAVDGYRQKGLLVETLRQTMDRRRSERWEKPILITEYGGYWDAYAGQGLEQAEVFRRLKSDLHVGIWASFLTGHPATPLFWWFDFIDKEKLYPHFKGLADFARGEDLRGDEWRSTSGRNGDRPDRRGRSASVRTSDPGRFLATGLVREDRALIWVHDRKILEQWPEKPASEPAGTRLFVVGLRDGVYRIECWDTLGKGIVKTLEAESEEEELSAELPEIPNDLAVKAIFLKERPASSGSSGAPVPKDYPGVHKNGGTNPPSTPTPDPE